MHETLNAETLMKSSQEKQGNLKTWGDVSMYNETRDMHQDCFGRRNSRCLMSIANQVSAHIQWQVDTMIQNQCIFISANIYIILMPTTQTAEIATSGQKISSGADRMLER
jgi:hypothetical protein